MKCTACNPRTWNTFTVRRRFVLISSAGGCLLFLLTTLVQIGYTLFVKQPDEEKWIKNVGTEPPEKSFIEKFSFIFFAVLYASMALCSLFGLLGAWRNSFKLTSIYVVASLLYVFTDTGLAIWNGAWLTLWSSGLEALDFTVSLLYLRDLQRRRAVNRERELPVESLGRVD